MTTEFWIFLAAVAGVLIASFAVGAEDGHEDYFRADRAWLYVVVAVAILSTPRFAYFGESRLSTFVTFVPFVWLPAVMVLAAFAGHSATEIAGSLINPAAEGEYVDVRPVLGSVADLEV